MSDVLFTAIIDNGVRVNYLSAIEIPTSLEHMFTTGLSADGLAPATHWVSSGYVAQEDIDLLALNGIEQYVDNIMQPLQGWDAINDAGLQLVEPDLAVGEGLQIVQAEIIDG